MLALSIQQPWAYAILHLGKDVENRTWFPPPTIVKRLKESGGRFLIHAGKKIDKSGVEWLDANGYDYDIDSPTGAIVGSVQFDGAEAYDEMRDGEDEWSFGPVLLRLSEPIIIDPIPYRGQLGFFEVEGITDGTDTERA